MKKGEIIRSIVLDEIQKEFVGPHEKHESFPVSDHPKNRYWSGVLYPNQSGIVEDDNVLHKSVQVTNSEESNNDEETPVNIGTKPSSLGITCYLEIDQPSVLAKISYGRYFLESDDTNELKKSTLNENEDENEMREDKSNIKKTWKRMPFEPEPISIDLTIPKNIIPLEDDKVFLKYNVNKNIEEEYLTLDIFLTNETPTEGSVHNSDCVFQPQILLTSPNNNKIFLNISRITQSIDDETNKTISFLFRNEKNFAQGKNCSVKWNLKEKEDKTDRIQTTYIPYYTIPEIKPTEPTDETKKSINMKKLSEVTNFKNYKNILEPIVNEYETWIKNLQNKLNSWEQNPNHNAETKFITNKENIPEQNVKNCKDTLLRIQNGLNKISTDPLIGEAFRFTNEVMYQNILHFKWAKSNKTKIENGQKVTEDGPNVEENNPEWRLFQIAFLLLNIESITDKNSKDRDIVDLLWFPTGGGKTEAYYGVIVFTLAYRRLKGKDAKTREEELDRYGVSVIMRYTYRLLTMQQFHRAATLLCACEYVRLKNENNIEKFGNEPFLVGLWVGVTMTPNSFDIAKKMIKQKRSNPSQPIREENPMQLLNCPWCGRKLDAYSYEFEKAYESSNKLRPKRIQIRCNEKCFFGKPHDPDRVLPVIFVDEDIQNLRPSLIISTVDKFAQFSWISKYSTLFGNVSKFCRKHGYNPGNASENNSKNKNFCTHKKTHKFNDGTEKPILFEINRKLNPPELIIQDELHLIVGPLGTLTGLYETAIDILFTNNGIRPKVITSTATTKKSTEQIKNLFNLESTKIFPPQGFEFGDSYFANPLPISEENPGKLHIGICSTTTSSYNVGIRIAAFMTRIIRYIRENKNAFYFNGEIIKFTDDDLDPYYTIINYYNTIKNLGAAIRMYEDTMPHYMDVMINSEKRFQNENNAKKTRSNVLQKEELTGRISATEIPKILKAIETKLGNNDVLDALLCTNTLSVGVDIDRLNVLIVNGQPKNTSEYIQASGRIGRNNPGIVLTNYTYANPRDLSYFENFIHFHTAYHKLIESSTLTPYSRRARDRGLSGVFLALVRLRDKILSDEPSKFDMENPRIVKLVENTKTEILKRVNEIDPMEVEQTKKDLEQIIEKWENLAKKSEENNYNLIYKRNPHPFFKKKLDPIMYLMNTSRDLYNDDTFIVLESLRDAESEITLYYKETR